MKQLLKKIIPPFFMALAIAILCNGCVGYRLGSMLPNDIKTVYVPNFINKTSEPLLEVNTTKAILDELQRDGSLDIAPENEADAILKVEITGYRLEPASYSSTRSTLAEEYRLVLTTRLILRRTSNNEILVQNPMVQGDAIFPFSGDLSSSKIRGLPDAAKDLAHNIVEQIVEMWQ